MKSIKFTQTLATTRELFLAGREYAVPDGDAARLVKDGVAVEQRAKRRDGRVADAPDGEADE